MISLDRLSLVTFANDVVALQEVISGDDVDEELSKYHGKTCNDRYIS